jgi:hypothetical protein
VRKHPFFFPVVARRRIANQNMPATKSHKAKTHIEYHKDGSIWAKGRKLDGKLDSYWEWFRKDGTRMRSGYFVAGQQAGQWTTYDKSGAVYKVTTFKTPVVHSNAKKLGGAKSRSSQRCELTTSATKRAAADRLAASVKETLPAGLSQPALRALAAAGIKRLDHCTRVTEDSLSKLHGMGPKAMAIVKAALKKSGKSFLSSGSR